MLMYFVIFESIYLKNEGVSTDVSQDSHLGPLLFNITLDIIFARGFQK